METYLVNTKCSNCGVGKTIQIPKGILIKSALNTETCDNCGCTSMKESEAHFNPIDKMRPEKDVKWLCNKEMEPLIGSGQHWSREGHLYWN